MKKILITLVAALMTPLAFAAQPSGESIRELMEITDTRNLVENGMNQADQMMQASMRQALQGQTIPAEDQKVLDDMRADMMALLKEEMSWTSMEPLFTEVYQKSLTQSEVDGMLEFYKSKAGKAVVAKMPLIMQNTMTLMQQRMAGVAPKMQEIQATAMAKLQENKSE
ncbi:MULTISPECIES: DUF2059 domain-containing protein [Microbulbifer]|uniref:DUF2059 domain-containing protein n=1 Tax=Microbulbifer celer TaxID=435905 RepID=A0ABW3U688_9GAMM|nr:MULTISPECIES: DUF2059 domain-containing protein [Microbulbifer]UFN56655.1 DUF2059 domain-containing protein [Microbulbifer celer]